MSPGVLEHTFTYRRHSVYQPLHDGPSVSKNIPHHLDRDDAYRKSLLRQVSGTAYRDEGLEKQYQSHFYLVTLALVTSDLQEKLPVHSKCEQPNIYSTKDSLSKPNLHIPSSMTQKPISHTYAPLEMPLRWARSMDTTRNQAIAPSHPYPHAPENHRHRKPDIPEERTIYGDRQRPLSQAARRDGTSNQWSADDRRPEPVPRVDIPTRQVCSSLSVVGHSSRQQYSPPVVGHSIRQHKSPPLVVGHTIRQHKQRRSSTPEGKHVRFGTNTYH